MGFWESKNVVIFGGSEGLGLEIARVFIEGQANVLIAGRTREKLDAAKTEIGSDNLSTIVADVTCEESFASAEKDIKSKFDSLNVLVNCVGKSTRCEFAKLTIEELKSSMEINFYSAVRGTNAFLPMLVESKGHLVNVGSLASKTAWPFMAPYSASKHALASYTHQLRLEGPSEVHYLHVCPGPIQRPDSHSRYAEQASDLPENARKPGAGANVKMICPNALAKKIVRGCERRKSEIVIPRLAKVLFSIQQISTRLGDYILRKKQK